MVCIFFIQTDLKKVKERYIFVKNDLPAFSGLRGFKRGLQSGTLKKIFLKRNIFMVCITFILTNFKKVKGKKIHFVKDDLSTRLVDSGFYKAAPLKKYF